MTAIMLGLRRGILAVARLPVVRSRHGECRPTVQDSVFLEQAGSALAAEDERLDRLAVATARGDSTAFETIYTETVDDVYSYLLGHTRDATAAEDLTSSVFLKAWKGAASYRAGSNRYRRWLFAIARNELRDSWRKERPTAPFDQVELADTGGTNSGSETAHLREMVSHALECLNDEQRQVVILRFFSEQSHAEIARILNKREGAVRVQLLRALRQMRKVMANAAP